MKKLFICLTIVALGLLQGISSYAEPVDLSPIPAINQSGESTSSVTESGLSSNEDGGSSTSSQAPVTSDNESLKPDKENPITLVEMLRQHRQIMSDMTLILTGEETIAPITRQYLSDENRYYVREGVVGGANPSVLIQTSTEGKVQKVFFPVDDLMSYAADLMTQQSEVYTGTAVEAFYQQIQEDSQSFEGRYIQGDVDFAAYQDVIDTVHSQNTFVLDVVEKWLARKLEPTRMEGDIIEFDIEETDVEFAQLVQEAAKNTPSLSAFLALSETYTGRIKLDFATKEVGVGLIADQSALEYYVRTNDLPVAKPVDNIISEEEFENLTGYRLFEGLLTPPATESLPVEEVSEESAE